jgi:uncharacterized membrane protein YphA (DoxX/SURF4 family)
MKNGFSWLLLAAIGLFFFASGVLKLQDLQAFGQAIMRYRIVGEHAAAVGSLMVPWVEIVASLGLVVKTWRQAALILILLLLFLFELALASAWSRGLDIDCGCLGSAGGSSIQMAFGRNILLIGGTAWLLYREDRSS